MKPTVLPNNAFNKQVRYTSSNISVATVLPTGEVVAKKPGRTIISCITRAGAKKTSLHLLVTRSFVGIRYHLFAIGNANYQGDSKLNGCKTDLSLVRATFQNATYSGVKPEITAKLNLTGAGIRSMLSNMSQGASEKDVTVFYYSGHGMSGNKYRGALCGIDWDMVTVDEVQKALDKVPGKVIVVLDCCLSGQYITGKGAPSDGSQGQLFDAFVEAFSTSYIADKALTDSAQKGKYKIITASAPRQSSYISVERGEPHSVFTEYFAEALGVALGDGATALAADKSGDQIVSLRELFAYIDKRVKAYVRRNPAHNQTTMVWPANDAFPVLARN